MLVNLKRTVLVFDNQFIWKEGSGENSGVSGNMAKAEH